MASTTLPPPIPPTRNRMPTWRTTRRRKTHEKTSEAQPHSGLPGRPPGGRRGGDIPPQRPDGQRVSGKGRAPRPEGPGGLARAEERDIRLHRAAFGPDGGENPRRQTA